MKLITIASSLVAGGLLLGSAVAGGPTPPAPPKPPKAAKAPKIHVQIDGLDEMIDAHIKQALDTVGNQPNIPPAVRSKLQQRLERVRKKIHTRVGNGSLDPDDMAELGEEIGDEMEEFGKEMEKWGEQFGKDMAKMQKQMGALHGQVGQLHGHGWDVTVDLDDDDDDDDDDLPDIDVDDDDDDLDAAVQALGNMKLKPAQREQIKKLRTDSDTKVAAAKRELDRASEQLQRQLENPAATDADIAKSIDAVTQQEAAIRKARILAWVNARRVLDDGQRAKVQGAVKTK